MADGRILRDVIRDLVNIDIPDHLATSKAIQQQLRITPDKPGLSDAYQLLVLLAGEMISLDTRVHNVEFAAQQGG